MKRIALVLILLAACACWADELTEMQKQWLLKQLEEAKKATQSPTWTNRVARSLGVTTNKASSLLVSNYVSVVNVLTNSSPAEIEKAVKWMVESGNFCKVRGHTWQSHIHTTLEYAPDRIDCRQCGICGLHQGRYAAPWPSK